MLLHQARPGFAAWFGREPVVDQGLRDHILADL
jgi:shikimate dehydrogenase